MTWPKLHLSIQHLDDFITELLPQHLKPWRHVMSLKRKPSYWNIWLETRGNKTLSSYLKKTCCRAQREPKSMPLPPPMKHHSLKIKWTLLPLIQIYHPIKWRTKQHLKMTNKLNWFIGTTTLDNIWQAAIFSKLGEIPKYLSKVKPPICAGYLFGAMTKKPWRTKLSQSKGRPI